mmetsp:Transcript_11575/g.30718  ORF Transcript_11575/g.30718 Transcript_11575/m.30718 type:complete len:428 (+) Transcript_11575:97-1380(+)
MARFARVAALLAALPAAAVVGGNDAAPSLARARAYEALTAVDPLYEGLTDDDQCSAGDESCALNALQLRKAKAHGQAAAEADGQAQAASNSSATKYSLNWEASGDTFFHDWTFVTEDEVHGAQQYEPKAQAFSDKLAYTQGGSAILKVGGMGAPYKRKSVNIHTNKAWSPQQSFVALLHYKHLPQGCSVWPGFWAMNSDQVWPGGGELDILEYANMEGNKVSFHTSHAGCYVDTRKVYSMVRGGNENGPVDCQTDYFNARPKFGCRPSQHSHTGEWWSGNPGLVGAEWTPTHVKVFHIPESQIPADIHAGEPKPDTWDRFIVAYLPFTPGCRSVAQPQELVLNIQLCGDWAGNAWSKSCAHARSGGCTNDIFNTPVDCCTQFVMSPQGEQTLRNAYFDIKSVKVFTPSGAYSKPSGTYMRGGMPLKR